MYITCSLKKCTLYNTCTMLSNFLIYNHRTLNKNRLLLKYIIHNHRSTRLHVDLPYVTVLITCTYKFRTCCWRNWSSDFSSGVSSVKTTMWRVNVRTSGIKSAILWTSFLDRTRWSCLVLLGLIGLYWYFRYIYIDNKNCFYGFLLVCRVYVTCLIRIRLLP